MLIKPVKDTMDFLEEWRAYFHVDSASFLLHICMSLYVAVCADPQ